MKAIFCVLALFCAVYAAEEKQDDNRALERLIDPHRDGVKDVLEDVKEFEVRMQEKIELDVNLLKADFMLEIESTLKETLQSIRDTITETGGENAEQCFEAAKTELNNLSANANGELEKCVETALNTIKDPFTKIVDITQNGNELLESFDTIISKCESSIPFKTRGCVMRKAAEARVAVKGLEGNARSVKRSITIAANANHKDTKNCMKKVETSVHIGITEVTVNAGTCIRTN